MCYHMNERSFISVRGDAPTSPAAEVRKPKAILAAALDLFLRQGYHGTSMRQIAAAAGIVPGAVYNHFPGKLDLYLTLLHEANIYNALGEALGGARATALKP